ncbi:hypothetical protein PIB30_068339, partial [Stylosanthes scabra]|nr:hypothetical protein [Stylosanthes scabra]
NDENNCLKAEEDGKKGKRASKEYGSWLREEIGGSLVKGEEGQQKENKEAERMRKEATQQKNTEKLLAKLRRLTMKENLVQNMVEEQQLEQIQGSKSKQVEESNNGEPDNAKKSDKGKPMDSMTTVDKEERIDKGRSQAQNSKLLEDSTNTKRKMTRKRGKTWKRKARQIGTAGKEGADKVVIGTQKTRMGEKVEMDIGGLEMKNQKRADEEESTSAVAAKQPFREQ